MAKIFSIQDELNNHPSRNNFDLSHRVHMTGKMGVLYPVLCKPVVPGDTFRISSGCSFNFMPMPYPTQTDMRFIMHYFYVRNKNIWKNWENWLQGLPDNDTGNDIVPPYIDQPVDFYKTGSLADFLGIPTTVKSTKPVVAFPCSTMGLPNIGTSGGMNLIGMSFGSLQKQGYAVSYGGITEDRVYGRDAGFIFSQLYTSQGAACTNAMSSFQVGNGWILPSGTDPQGVLISRFMKVPRSKVPLRINSDGSLSFTLNNPMVFLRHQIKHFVIGLWCDPTGNTPLESHLVVKSITDMGVQEGHYQREFYLNNLQTQTLVDMMSDPAYAHANFYISVSGYVGPQTSTNWPDCSLTSFHGEWPLDVRHAQDLDNLPDSCPYFSVDNEDDTVKISALPFRAYESIYNAFYRNTHGVQPFMIDGRVQYNKYNTDLGDGADYTEYRLFQRNWELDAYTSCLPSPQQGNAPLVGISSLGRITVVDPDTGDTSTAQLTDTRDGIRVTDVNIVNEVHSRYIMNVVNSGISISDFRQVNALQRFLETNIRKGFRYVDFIEGHFGHRIKDAIMDMPEFIGGFSEKVRVSMISNTTAQTDADDNELLGSYGGQAAAFGGSAHDITHFCDDYGFIIGILCLVPTPSYSQILPKHFFNMSPFDYYFPEFAQIGMQPVTYQEVCPVQSHMQHLQDENVKLTDVFGYQRPNHDLVWYMDTLHGEFRKTFSDFIVNRVYAERPQLGDEFLRIKPEETNSIFNYTAPDGDVFVGQLAFDIKAKRPVPRVVIPGLGR